MIFWLLLILSSVNGASTTRESLHSQNENPIYDLELSSKIHLKWQIDYSKSEVVFEVGFVDKNQGHFQGNI